MRGGILMSRLTKYTETAGFNAGAEAFAKWMDPREIKINPDIAKLFENDRGVVEKIREEMIERGFDKSEPLVTWNGTVVDGHTRLKAALEAELEKVLVEEKDFADVEAAKIYTLRRQLNRRNLTAAALLEIAALLDAMKNGGKAKHEVAKDLGVGRTTLYRAQEVNRKAPEPVKERIRQGDLTINEVYEQMKPSSQKKPKALKPARYQDEGDGCDDFGDGAEEDEEAVLETESRPAVSPPVSRETEKQDRPSIKGMFEEIACLLEAFLEANEGGVFDGLEKSGKVREAYALALEAKKKLI